MTHASRAIESLDHTQDALLINVHLSLDQDLMSLGLAGKFVTLKTVIVVDLYIYFLQLV